MHITRLILTFTVVGSVLLHTQCLPTCNCFLLLINMKLDLFVHIL